jgi:hypothetical protein
MPQTRVVVVADDSYVQNGIAAALSDDSSSLWLISRAATTGEARRMSETMKSGIFVVDTVGMCLELSEIILKTRSLEYAPSMPVLLLTANGNWSDMELLRLGGPASGNRPESTASRCTAAARTTVRPRSASSAAVVDWRSAVISARNQYGTSNRCFGRLRTQWWRGRQAMHHVRSERGDDAMRRSDFTIQGRVTDTYLRRRPCSRAAARTKSKLRGPV